MALLNILNLRDSYLIAGQVITPSMTEFQINNAEDEFGDVPYILTLTTGLDYISLKEGERVYVEAVDGNTVTVIRGFDDSDERDWTPTEGNPVYAYMIFTAGYYDELRSMVDYLDNKPVTLEMSNVDLDIASILTHSISVSDGLNIGAGWNVSYEIPYKVSINTTSELDQSSGQLNLISSVGIAITAVDDITLKTNSDISLIGADLWLNNILQVAPNTVRTIGSVEHDNLVNFMQGLKLADQDIANPEPGMIKFVESGSPGFWGYYDGEWHKLGYTAQILIGQSTLLYCYLDGDHYTDDNPIRVRDISGDGNILVGDKLLIGNDVYTVTDFDDILLDVTIDPALLEDTLDMTPILIMRVVTDADDGYTVRYNKGLEQWQATNMLVLPEYSSEATTFKSHVEIGEHADGDRRNLDVSGVVRVGQLSDGDPLVAGSFGYRNNQFYATVMAFDALLDDWVPVEVQLLPSGAYEFLSLIYVDPEAPDGIMIRYNKTQSQWVATDDLVIDYSNHQMVLGNTGTTDITEIIFNKPVTFLGSVNLELGLSFGTRITFEDGIRIYNDEYEPITLECNIDYISNFKTYDEGTPYGMFVWYGQKTVGGDIVQRPFSEFPFIDDVDKPVGEADRAQMMPITFSGGNGGAESAHWELRYINLEIVAGEYRFPPRMHSDEPEGYAGHIHPWSDIDPDTIELPNEFDYISMPIGGIGDYKIFVGSDVPTPDQNMRYFRVRADSIKPEGWGLAHSSNLWVADAGIEVEEEIEYMMLDHSFYGDLTIKRMDLGPDPNWLGGHLIVESTIQIGDLVSGSEILSPGMIRYRTNGAPLSYPGDFQGYVCLARDEEGTPFYGWVSLTGGLPRPTTQRIGGTLFFNNDPIDPQWDYSEDFLIGSDAFEFHLPVNFYDDIYIHGEFNCEYLETGPIKVGTAPWCVDPLHPLVRDGLLSYFDNSLWIYSSGMWKDLLNVNAAEIDIPIIPIDDGVILRYDLSGAVWEATGVLRVPTTDDRIDIYVETNIDGVLNVTGDTVLESHLFVTDRAFFDEMIRIGHPESIDDFEGMVRYNGDFEGYIPEIGWVSFTRRFDEAHIAPPTTEGQLLVSKYTGANYNWIPTNGIYLSSTFLSFERDLLVFGELDVDGTAAFRQNVQISDSLVVGSHGIETISSYVFETVAAGSFTVKIAVLLGVEPSVGGRITLYNILGEEEEHFVSDYSPITAIVTLITATEEDIALGAPCKFETTALSSTGLITASAISVGTTIFEHAYAGSIFTESLLIGAGTFGYTPGAIRYYNNIFQGLYAGNVWKDFGPIDLEEIFNVSSEWWKRTYGDILIDDGRGRFVLSDQINLGGDRITLNTRQLFLRDAWDIQVWRPTDSSESFNYKNYQFAIHMYYDDQIESENGSHPNKVLALNVFKGSVLWSDFEIGGYLRVQDQLYVGDTADIFGFDGTKYLYVGGSAQIQGDLKVVSFYTTSMECTGTAVFNGPFVLSDSPIIHHGGQFVFGTFPVNYETYYDTGRNWLGGDTGLEGRLTVTLDANIEGSLQVNGSARFGPYLPWHEEAVVGKDFIGEDGHVFINKSVYCNDYVVPHKPDLVEYYAPKGAIRYTGEGPEDRGDWEGWDGTHWRSFTHTHVPGEVFFGFANDGDTLRFNALENEWRPSSIIQNFVTSVNIKVPTAIGFDPEVVANNTIQVKDLIDFDDANFGIFLGTEAFTYSRGVRNIGIGYRAGYNNDDAFNLGRDSIYIGYLSGYGATPSINNSGIVNIGIGAYALYSNTSGGLNTAIGDSALRNNTTGTYNFALGYNALYWNTTGGWNVGIGVGALNTNDGGNHNLAIGFYAGYYNVIGDRSIFLGAYAGMRQTGSATLSINNQDQGTADAEARQAIIFGQMLDPLASYTNYTQQTLSLNANTSIFTLTAEPFANFKVNQPTIGPGVVFNTVSDTEVMGINTQFTNTFKVGDTITIGVDICTIASITDDDTLYVEDPIPNFHTGVSYTLTGGTRFVVLGNGNVGIGVTTPNNLVQVADLINFGSDGRVVLFGYEAFNNEIGEDNVGIGYRAGYYNTHTTVDTGYRNVYIGHESGGGGNPNMGQGNTGVGFHTLYSNTAGSYNSAYGINALRNNTTGNYNVAIGNNACNSNATGEFNTALGRRAGGYTESLTYNRGYNTTIGGNSGYNLTTGSQNIFLGFSAGFRQTTNSNLFIVDNQGRSSVAEEQTNALLYGIMNPYPGGQSLRINGTLSLNGVTGSGTMLVGLQLPDLVLNNPSGVLAGEYINISGTSIGIGLSVDAEIGQECSGILLSITSQNKSAHGFDALVVHSESMTDEAVGLVINNVETDGSGNAYGIKVITITSDSGIGYCFYANSGIGRFPDDLEILGTVYVSTDVESYSTALNFHTSSITDAFGFDSVNAFWVNDDINLAYSGRTIKLDVQNDPPRILIEGTQVVTEQQPAIADAETIHNIANFNDAEIAMNALGTQINEILDILRIHGLIAT